MPRGKPLNPMSEAERKDARRETQRKYSQKNPREKVAMKQFRCPCGGTYTKYFKKQHMTSSKHQFFEKERPIIELWSKYCDISFEEARDKLENYYDKRNIFSKAQKEVELNSKTLFNTLKKKIAEKQAEECVEAENINEPAEDTTRCSGCDQIPNEDGCDCRMVMCNNCGENDKIYNMEHKLKEYDEYDYLSFNDKLEGFYCAECYEASLDNDEEEMTETNDYNSGDESC